MNLKDLEVKCPVCGKGSLKMRYNVHSIPYFGKIQEISIFCEYCGFKHNDILCLEDEEPMGYEVWIEGPEDLKIRIIRSSSGTIEIPELGVKIEPGPASMGFISNVEGVLERVLEALDVAIAGAKSEEERKRGEEIKRRIEEVKEGNYKIRLILKDPMGNSAIISEKAKRWKLSKEEVEELKTGFLRFEVSGNDEE